jgi:hypothetical protein
MLHFSKPIFRVKNTKIAILKVENSMCIFRIPCETGPDAVWTTPIGEGHLICFWYHSYNSGYGRCHRHNQGFSWPDSKSPVKTGQDAGWTIQIKGDHPICFWCHNYDSGYSRCHRHNQGFLWPDSEPLVKTSLDTDWTTQIREGHLVAQPQFWL